jgi:ribonuclease P protein subunit POP4
MADNPDIPFPQALLARAHSPNTAEHHYTERILKRPLFLRPTSPVPSARATRRQTLNARKEKAIKRSKLKPRPLSAATKRSLDLFTIPKHQQKYEIYAGLHKLWCGYMREVLGVDINATTSGDGDGSGSGRAQQYVTAASAGQMLASADMHGALMEVVRSRCVSRVGIKGIVVRDTKFTFVLITEKNKVKEVPKEHTMFRFEVPLVWNKGEKWKKPFVFEILGEQFQARAPDRANKKWRMHYMADV